MKKELQCSQCGLRRRLLVKGSFVIQTADPEGVSRREDRPKTICFPCLLHRAEVIGGSFGPSSYDQKRTLEVLL